MKRVTNKMIIDEIRQRNLVSEQLDIGMIETIYIELRTRIGNPITAGSMRSWAITFNEHRYDVIFSMLESGE